jgi:hypothetical protein
VESEYCRITANHRKGGISMATAIKKVAAKKKAPAKKVAKKK